MYFTDLVFDYLIFFLFVFIEWEMIFVNSFALYLMSCKSDDRLLSNGILFLSFLMFVKLCEQNARGEHFSWTILSISNHTHTYNIQISWHLIIFRPNHCHWMKATICFNMFFSCFFSLSISLLIVSLFNVTYLYKEFYFIFNYNESILIEWFFSYFWRIFCIYFSFCTKKIILKLCAISIQSFLLHCIHISRWNSISLKGEWMKFGIIAIYRHL